MAGNSITIQDPQGQYDDWLELYNRTDQVISLNGMYLSDESDNALKWVFPDTSIAAHGYLLIWIDDDEHDLPGLHASFHLDKGGEYIGLYDTDLNGNVVIDSTSFGPQEDDISEGRYPNGAGNFVFMTTPTSNAANIYATGVAEDKINLPGKSRLMQNYPNPFNGKTVIPYVIRRPGRVRLSILNLEGQCVKLLVDCFQEQGSYSSVWDGSDSEGRRIPSGIYFSRLRISASISTRRLLLVQ